MRNRSTITAAFALAAATILAVAACASSVTGSAQPNSVAAQTMSIPTSAETSLPDRIDPSSLQSDLAEITSMLSDLPTDLSIPTDLTFPTDFTLPTDFTIPSDLADLTNLNIPGYNGACLSVASAYASISLALLPTLFGGTDAFNAGDLQATLNSLAGQVPPELAGDIQALGEVAAEASGKSLSDASALFESDKFTTASNNIDAWLTANCGG